MSKRGKEFHEAPTVLYGDKREPEPSILGYSPELNDIKKFSDQELPVMLLDADQRIAELEREWEQVSKEANPVIDAYYAKKMEVAPEDPKEEKDAARVMVNKKLDTREKLNRQKADYERIAEEMARRKLKISKAA